MILNLICHSCGKECSPENPCTWIGIPTYHTPCFARIRKEGRWNGMEYYKKVWREYPK